MPQKRRVSLYFGLGLICAFVSLFIVPEIFGSAAIILGAYTWKLDSSENKSRGLVLIIFGIITMLVGIYYTSILGIYNILP
jgi:membrane-bound ClpP family serine protease